MFLFRFRHARPAALIAPALLLVFVGLTISPSAVTPASAQSGAGLVRPRELALAPAVFPHTATLQRAPAGNAAADAATELHATPSDQLGRVNGYLETAWWLPSRADRADIRLQYEASQFASAAAAATACADARASLWE
ncbi:MAG TPA: hypothetical protein VF898_12735, partial [Chloroflexota bacterium]